MLLKVIKENGFSVSDVAGALKIDKSTFYRKINGDIQSTLSINEANTIKDFVGMTSEQANAIFLLTTSHKCDN